MLIVARFPVSSRDEHTGIPGSPAQKMRAPRNDELYFRL
jgi:hypothetical protein